MKWLNRKNTVEKVVAENEQRFVLLAITFATALQKLLLLS